MKNNLVLINEVFARLPNKYMAAVVASKRAREITAGIRPLVETDAAKPTTVALTEIAVGAIVPGFAKPEHKLPVVDAGKREVLPASELALNDIEETEEAVAETDVVDEDVDEETDEDEVDLVDDIVIDIDQPDDLDDEEIKEDEEELD